MFTLLSVLCALRMVATRSCQGLSNFSSTCGVGMARSRRLDTSLAWAFSLGDGAVGFFIRNGHMTTPLFGYDTGLPPALGLYRMLSMVTYREARERQLLLNQSSGAGNFKRTRGGRPNVEYSVVYERHLPAGRRLVWQALARTINGVAVPLMRQYKL